VLLVSKARLALKVLLGLELLELRGLQDNKARLALAEQLEWSALAELRD
jgi:hypothetical protein